MAHNDFDMIVAGIVGISTALWAQKEGLKTLIGFIPTKVPNPPQDLTMLEARLSGQVAAA